ncbi:MAG: Bpu10I family restriction endonuclease [Cyanobacteriota bacterium]|nr:Bpu10I family restriction endonuclease [Cyanobacteriota bacterium]
MESHIGYVCAECKTNLDKTMFQEAVATSRDLKKAVRWFPILFDLRISRYDTSFYCFNSNL